MASEATGKSQLEALKTAHQGALQHVTATHAARISELETALRAANDKASSLELEVQKQTTEFIAVTAKYVDSCYPTITQTFYYSHPTNAYINPTPAYLCLPNPYLTQSLPPPTPTH